VFENFMNNYDAKKQTRAIMSSTNDIIQQKNFEMVECCQVEWLLVTVLIHMWKRKMMPLLRQRY
jgi:hypothetical protein